MTNPEYAKIGSYKTRVEITRKYGLTFLWMHKGEGCVIRLGGYNVAFISPYWIDWLKDASRKEIYQQLLTQSMNQSGGYSFKEGSDYDKAFKDYITKHLDSDTDVDSEEFKKQVDKLRLMESLQ